MFYTNVWLTVQDSQNTCNVRELLAEAGRSSRTEPGCRRFEVYQSEADPQKFLLCEQWETKADWETHRTGHAYTQIYQPKILPLVTREGHPSQLVE